MKRNYSKTRSLDFKLSSMKDLPELSEEEENQLKKYQICSLKKLKFNEEIGKGGSSRVYLGTYDSRIICIKEMLRERMNTQRYRIQFLQEILTISGLRHRNILKFVGSYYFKFDNNVNNNNNEEEKRILYLCEYISCGSVYSLLKDKDDKNNNNNNNSEKKNEILGSLDKKIRFIYGICAGLKYIHSNGFIHGDFKSMNILIQKVDNNPEKYIPVICDFGFLQSLRTFSTTAETTTTNKEEFLEFPLNNEYRIIQPPRGTIYWNAPENLLVGKESFICQKSDIWSLGVIIWEILTELKPYENNLEKMNPLKVKFLLPLEKIKLSLDCIDDSFLKILLGDMCLVFNPFKRSNVEEIMKFLKDKFPKIL